MSHMETHNDPTCNICREEAINILNDGQERANIEQELEPDKFREGLTWAEWLERTGRL